MLSCRRWTAFSHRYYSCPDGLGQCAVWLRLRLWTYWGGQQIGMGIGCQVGWRWYDPWLVSQSTSWWRKWVLRGGQGDSYGRYTYSSALGSGTVVSGTVVSDHSKIPVYLKSAILNHEASKPKELNNIKKCNRRKESSVETYQKQLDNIFKPF